MVACAPLFDAVHGPHTSMQIVSSAVDAAVPIRSWVR